jgi:hypothetical protein
VTFVTMKHPGYCLFSTTPSERAAVGLTDDQRRVHLLARAGAGWTVEREWSVDEHPLTEVMLRLGRLPQEPATFDELARLAVGA